MLSWAQNTQFYAAPPNFSFPLYSPVSEPYMRCQSSMPSRGHSNANACIVAAELCGWAPAGTLPSQGSYLSQSRSP